MKEKLELIERTEETLNKVEAIDTKVAMSNCCGTGLCPFCL